MKTIRAKELIVFIITLIFTGSILQFFGDRAATAGKYVLSFGIFIFIEVILISRIGVYRMAIEGTVNVIKYETMELDEFDRKTVNKMISKAPIECKECKKCWMPWDVITVAILIGFIMIPFAWFLSSLIGGDQFLIAENIVCWVSTSIIGSAVFIPIMKRGEKARFFRGVSTRIMEHISEMESDE